MNVSFPSKGQRILLKPPSRLVALAGVQMKAELPFAPTVGVVRDVLGNFPPGTTRTEAKTGKVLPTSVEVTLETDDGAIVTLTTPGFQVFWEPVDS